MSRILSSKFISLLGFLLLELVMVGCVSRCNCTNTVSSPKIGSVKIPSSVSFASEKLPLETQEVRERLERELIVNQNYHTSTILIYKSIARYKDLILKILKENEVPEDFFYLAVAESALNPNATSSANAVGVWQFMQPTAEAFGLEINSYVDERRNLVKATKAACRHLRESYKEFGSWTMAAAAYNRGNRGLKDAVVGQKQTDYYKLYLNQETYRYVFRIVALKIILTNPEDYNFALSQDDMYPTYKLRSVIVKESIPSLPEFAIAQGTNYKELILHNPWIRTGKYNFDVGKDKTYEFLLPDN
ncbi:MAG: lytic transglycosylase domain-containing protein [Leptospiraceae bacterium]|nr:lytic transglycosylase domain-containing protein [Leptospiraceae bacterium]